MLQISASAALWFLPFVIPIAIWVAWSDMAFMKIPNKSVMALTLVYAVIGLIALSFPDYAWRWLHLVVILVIGFVMSMTGLLGAGDAKFAAAMAPFVAFGDIASMLYILAAVSVVSFICHRTVRAIPAVRRALPTWESWTNPKFPMGLALGTALVIYLTFGALYGS